MSRDELIDLNEMWISRCEDKLNLLYAEYAVLRKAGLRDGGLEVKIRGGQSHLDRIRERRKRQVPTDLPSVQLENLNLPEAVQILELTYNDHVYGTGTGEDR